MDDFPQLQSLSKFELYTMGRSQYAGVKVASSQTHEDDKEEEQQTDEVGAEGNGAGKSPNAIALAVVGLTSCGLTAGRPGVILHVGLSHSSWRDQETAAHSPAVKEKSRRHRTLRQPHTLPHGGGQHATAQRRDDSQCAPAGHARCGPPSLRFRPVLCITSAYSQGGTAVLRHPYGHGNVRDKGTSFDSLRAFESVRG